MKINLQMRSFKQKKLFVIFQSFDLKNCFIKKYKQLWQIQFKNNDFDPQTINKFTKSFTTLAFIALTLPSIVCLWLFYTT